jgi:glycosyltransferase involved in cell wall biosynthesis
MSRRWSPAPEPVAARGAFPDAPPGVPVKVLHVITRFEAGAGGNTLLSAAGMNRERYDVWVAGGAGGPLWEQARRLHVRTVELPGLRREVAPLADLRTLVRLVALLRRERFGLVHVHSAKAGVLGRVAALVCRTPVVVYTLHGRDPWWPAPDRSSSELREVMSKGLRTFLLAERLLRRTTHRFVAVAPTVARDGVLAGVASAGRIDVAASAVDLSGIPEDMDPDARAELGGSEGGPLIGTVGRLDAQKAPLDFVRMAGEVTRTHPEARFVMIGDGDLLPAAQDLAATLGVRIHFTGFRADAARLASAFDVFVVTSLYEGVGRSVTEAMASARPVVATAVDGVVDLVAPGSTGLLCAPRDPTGLATAVRWMLDNPVEAGLMGKLARDRVRILFAPERMCATLDEIYAGLLGLEPLSGEATGWVTDD